MVEKCVGIQVIVPKAIITISNLTALPTSAMPGDTVILTAAVINTGNAAGTVTVTFKKGTSVVETTAAQVVQPNNTMNFKSSSIPITVADGSSQVNFCAETQCTVGC